MIDDNIKYRFAENNPEVFADLVVAIYENAIVDYEKSIATLVRLLQKKRDKLSKDDFYKIIESERLMHDVDIFLKKHEYNISEACCEQIYKKMHSYLDDRQGCFLISMVYDYVYGRGKIWTDYQQRLSGKRPRKLEVSYTRSKN